MCLHSIKLLLEKYSLFWFIFPCTDGKFGSCVFEFCSLRSKMNFVSYISFSAVSKTTVCLWSSIPFEIFPPEFFSYPIFQSKPVEVLHQWIMLFQLTLSATGIYAKVPSCNDSCQDKFLTFLPRIVVPPTLQFTPLWQGTNLTVHTDDTSWTFPYASMWC